MNKITDKLQTGTLGELLVQIRLLQYGVQAAPPIKDSGNDLIAVNGQEFRAISVRTTTGDCYNRPNDARLYHVLAVVQLHADETDVFLDDSELFLIPQTEVRNVPTRCDQLQEFKLCRELVEKLFGNLTV